MIINKKEIKIDFVSFWPNFNKNDNFIMNSLKKKYNVTISNDPDFIFCSVFDRNNFINYKENVVRILFTGENCRPNFNLYDYAMGFDYIEFGDRYLRYPLWVVSYLKNTTNLISIGKTIEKKKAFVVLSHQKNGNKLLEMIFLKN